MSAQKEAVSIMSRLAHDTIIDDITQLECTEDRNSTDDEIRKCNE